MSKKEEFENQEHQNQKEQEVSNQNQELSEVELKIQDLEKRNSQLLLALADSKNDYNLLLKKTQERVDFALTNFASDLSEIVEVFFLASQSVKQEHIEKDAHFKSFFEGIEMTKTQMIEMLKKHKVERVNPIGDKFDRLLHQAISVIESEEEEGKIINVLKTGYTLNGRIIKPALVVVSSGKK